MSVRIVYQDIAAGADEDAVISTNAASDFSNPDMLPLASSEIPIATLEPDSWILDGSRQVLDTQEAGFWSHDASGADGRFSDPPEITVIFSKRYTSPGIYLTFDPSTGEYCSEAKIAWYRGDSLLYQGTFFPDSALYFCEKTVEAYDKISIQLNAASLPFRYAKLSKITFGVAREFGLEELRNVQIVEEVSLISSEVAVNTLHFTLDSQTDVAYMFQFKQPVYAYDGARLIGVFYIDTSSHRGHGLYDVSCIDAIGVLDEDVFPASLYSGYPAKTLLEEILGGHFRLELDNALLSASVTGYLPDCTRREALQQVAFALCAMADTSGSEAVRVYRDREITAKKIPLSRSYDGGSVEKSAIVTAVRVTSHTYSTSGDGNDTVEIDGVNYYHKTAVTTIKNPNATASDKQNVIEVTGATLVNPANVSMVAQHLYNHYTKRSTQKIKLILDGEKPGDHIATATPWGTIVDGYLTSMRILLSGIAAADCEIIGTDVEAVGDSEVKYSGEFYSGEV